MNVARNLSSKFFHGRSDVEMFRHHGSPMIASIPSLHFNTSSGQDLSPLFREFTIDLTLIDPFHDEFLFPAVTILIRSLGQPGIHIGLCLHIFSCLNMLCTCKQNASRLCGIFGPLFTESCAMTMKILQNSQSVLVEPMWITDCYRCTFIHT